jgi:hypothetical protein
VKKIRTFTNTSAQGYAQPILSNLGPLRHTACPDVALNEQGIKLPARSQVKDGEKKELETGDTGLLYQRIEKEQSGQRTLQQRQQFK